MFVVYCGLLRVGVIVCCVSSVDVCLLFVCGVLFVVSFVRYV